MIKQKINKDNIDKNNKDNIDKSNKEKKIIVKNKNKNISDSRCIHITQRGERCKNNIGSNTKYCSVHK